jgi:hypothetical protein
MDFNKRNDRVFGKELVSTIARTGDVEPLLLWQSNLPVEYLNFE